MKFAFKMAAAALVASSTMAHEKEAFEQASFELAELEHPFVGASSIFPVDGWGATDWVFGLLIGAYNPLQKRWRNHDCRSSWFGLGTNLIGYSKYFDKPFNADSALTWVVMVLRLGNTALSTYTVASTCGRQYEALNNPESPEYHWFKEFNFLSNDLDLEGNHPIVGNSFSTV